MCSEEIIRLAADINQICKELDEKWSLNCGGCCLVSQLIAEGLERLKVKYKLVVYFHDYMSDSPASKVRKDIKARDLSKFPNGEETGSHYAIYIPRIKVFLNKSIYNRRDHRQMFIGRVNCSDIKWIYDTGDWNDCYDTRHNRLLMKRLKSIFKKYEKEERSKVQLRNEMF